jgi:hypothetical protein
VVSQIVVSATFHIPKVLPIRAEQVDQVRNLKDVLRLTPDRLTAHSKKTLICQCVGHLICCFDRRSFCIRSPRITVLYLQGEGRYWNVRPGTSLFY